MNPDQEWTNDKLSVTVLNKQSLSTPFMAIDLDDVERKYKSLQSALPQAKIFYAVKCNPESPILERLASLGSGFEIASAGEFSRVSAVTASREIVFSNTIKTVDDITAVSGKDISGYAFDSKSEIKRLAKAAPGANVFLRLAVSNYGSAIPLVKKFGAQPNEALELMLMAKEHNLNVVGVSFHVGSQAENIRVWSEAIEVTSEVVHAAKAKGLKLAVLNIGGGFPIRYSSLVPSVEEIAEEIKGAIVQTKLDHMELWLEPGRYLVGEAGVVAATVLAKVDRAGVPWLYLDVGRFNCFAELFESEEIRYPILSSRDESMPQPDNLDQVVLTGPTCDSFDTIYTDALVNKKVREGDRLYFASTGAYTHVYGSSFNDFNPPRCIIV